MSFWVRKKETIPTSKTQCNLKLRRLAQRRIATSLAGFFFSPFWFYSLMEYRMRLISENTPSCGCVCSQMYINFSVIVVYFLHYILRRRTLLSCMDLFLILFLNMFYAFFISCLWKFQNECHPQEAVDKVHD